MKKLLLLLLLIPSTLYALDCSIEAGIQSGGIMEDNFRYDKPPLFVEISIQQELGGLTMYGSWKSEIEKVHSIWFSPMQNTYTVGANLCITDSINMSAIHYCNHSQNPYGWYDIIHDEWYSSVSIKYTTE